MSAQHSALPLAQRFGDYLVVNRLAIGGMAELYLAARRRGDGQTELGVIKRVLPHLGFDPEFVRMFLEEVRIAAMLVHPNIVRVHDWGTSEGGHYLAMEYLHGQTLRQTLGAFKGGRPPLEFALGVVLAVADGLQHAHEYISPDRQVSGLVHRDVSPSNVMVCYDGTVKLLDFGIARCTGHTSHTRTGIFKGKIGYMSPEQCQGEAVDRRTDVFGLGVLLYELTTGRRAFYADSDFAVIGKTLSGSYTPPSEIVDGYPSALEQVIGRALEVEPDERLGTASEVAVRVRRYAQAQGLILDPVHRGQWMCSLFPERPWPVADISLLEGTIAAAAAADAHAARRRHRQTLAVSLLVGGVGFLAGAWTQSLRSAASEQTTADRKASPVAKPAPPPPVRPPPNTVVSSVDPSAPAQPPAVDTAPPAIAAAPLDTPAGPSEDDDIEVVDEPAPRRRRPPRSRQRGESKSSASEPPSAPSLLPPSWRQ